MSNQLEGKVALVAGATRGAGRGIAVALGEAGATVYCTGRSTRGQRSEYDRPETIEETAELVDAAGGTGVAVVVDHLDPAAVRELVARIDARPRTVGPAGQRHLGRREAVQLRHAAVGARPGRWAPPAAPGGGDPPGHQPRRAAAADPSAGRAGRGDDRRHPRLQRVAPAREPVLRPGQGLGPAAGVRPGQAARAARLRRGGADAGLDALGDDARGVRRERGELERAGQGTAALRRHLREPPVRGPRRGRAGRRPRSSPSATAARSPPASWRGSTASPTWTAPSPTAGDTWSRSRTRGCRRTRPGTARRPLARRRRGGRR